MASRRVVSSSALRALSSSIVSPGRLLRLRPAQQRIAVAVQPRPSFFPLQQVRLHSGSGSKSKVYQFNDVQSLVDNPTEDRILIDVREPSEYEAGFIPSAINIPIASQPDALFLPADEFEDRFGFTKPPPNKELVFYCKAGVRSSAAAQLAQQGGYDKVGEYRGSWLDWAKNGGETSK
ncbi:Rhodanese-like protein [Xylona heveae TC161]|uniref:Rhodanese-like protein n=1 Tax=Xylona heveae (strain CBS 132557 / TC161) TaxID=1328760 RepID=A0A165HF56_XYLHT|nr:Rhodanese-like protein [Xylona heveae TC161]KZF23416.1 Rhodanese-like protein [Xylona heveae TC161]